jgi:hypothetical protein
VLIAATASALALGGVGISGLTGLAAAPTGARSATATAVIKAPPDATWYGQMTASSICRMIPGCTTSTKVKGGYRLTLRGYLAGLGEIQQDVNAKVIKKVPPRLMRLRLSSQSGFGSLSATTTITLQKKSPKATTLRVKVTKASGTGALGTILLPYLATRLHAGVTTYGNDLNQQLRASGIAVKARTTPRGKKRTVRIQVLLTKPIVQPSPTAKGKARVTNSKGKVLCRAKVRKSTGRCSYRKGPKQPRIVVTGKYTNGFPIWHATTGRAAK